MGKSKKRIFNKNINTKGTTLKRNDIIKRVISDLKNNKLSAETKNLISLFGIETEELLEAGMSIEELNIINSYSI